MNGTPAAASQTLDYQLSDDLARLCLPGEFKDSCRNLAWANSICALFLVVGMVGLKSPGIFVRTIKTPAEPVKIEILQPEIKPAQPEVLKPKEEEQPPDLSDTAPQIVQIVAAAPSPSIKFAVTVPNANLLAPTAEMAPPPPQKISQQSPQAPVRFDRSLSDGGSYPDPMYPSLALRSQMQGTVYVEVQVDATGAITSVKLQKSSGHHTLDEAALQVVKTRWRFPPGVERWYVWACTFKLQ